MCGFFDVAFMYSIFFFTYFYSMELLCAGYLTLFDEENVTLKHSSCQ